MVHFFKIFLSTTPGQSQTSACSQLTSAIFQSDAHTLLNKLLYVDTKTYLHELLMKQDQMSMAASIESRVPFLDHELVEFAARMPERMKVRSCLEQSFRFPEQHCRHQHVYQHASDLR